MPLRADTGHFHSAGMCVVATREGTEGVQTAVVYLSPQCTLDQVVGT